MKVPTFLVEDNVLIRQQLIPALSDLGEAHVVSWAEGETEAKQWLNVHAQLCQLVVVDLFLKEGSGLGVVRACKQMPSALSVVLLSNYATDEMRRRARHAGADAVFDKSTELDDFFAFCALIRG